MFQFTDKNGKKLAEPLMSDVNGIVIRRVYLFRVATITLAFKTLGQHNSPFYAGFRAIFSLTDGK